MHSALPGSTEPFRGDRSEASAPASAGPLAATWFPRVPTTPKSPHDPQVRARPSHPTPAADPASQYPNPPLTVECDSRHD